MIKGIFLGALFWVGMSIAYWSFEIESNVNTVYQDK